MSKELLTKIGTSFHADIYIAGDPTKIKHCCMDFVQRGLCVSLFPCEYIHTDGSESGYLVRLINYPRFPKGEIEIEKSAIDLAIELIEACGQLSASVVCHPSGITTFIYDEEKER